jgi:NADH-quinone oxidoreductase subunit A
MEPISLSYSFSPWQPGGLSLFLYIGLVLAAIIVLLFLISLIGEKKPRPEKEVPYECGVIPTGSARFRYPVPFYLVAIFFVIFDVETAFIFAWALAVEDLGWSGYIRITFFIIVLLLSLFYVWRKGALEWKSSR